jgi:SEC-C motif-containing protein
MNCICGSDKTWKDCCAPLLLQGKSAATAEALMRSRYVAYVRRDGDYLYKTWASETRPTKASLKQLALTDWQGLTVIRTELGDVDEVTGVVEFIAHWRDEQGNLQEMHEVSEFVREKGRWVYLRAQV